MRNAITVMTVVIAAAFAGCATLAHSQEAPQAAAPAPLVYSDATPAYRFYPGDEIEIAVFSAPELTRTVTVAPDGRIALPLIGAVRAADLTAAELHDALVAQYAQHLRMPELTVTPRSYGSRQVFVGGEVARPGIYEMPAQIDAFQAVALAGGFLPTARRGDVLVLSRASGETQVNEIDLSPRAMRQGFPDAQPLQRYDVVYVPRSRISQVNLFMQQYVRDALPVQFSFYYDLRGERNN
ncbi:MAG TPA: polysaccharide biosynthesis/export family protein [Vitreimonas sp.]|uniref:polysaccharide biosynthesis/export family protein n=1 Tax=Vitreimonas sp. TaxID=3069702 RepID=UPI002D5ACC38|nr:polysaccharide biosynthesis/export family protein [Vitreimonas sp.]HYD86893.1 polysaccharide biosynthesis/export family protein [Vitreimonas sp.]